MKSKKLRLLLAILMAGLFGWLLFYSLAPGPISVMSIPQDESTYDYFCDGKIFATYQSVENGFRYHFYDVFTHQKLHTYELNREQDSQPIDLDDQIVRFCDKTADVLNDADYKLNDFNPRTGEVVTTKLFSTRTGDKLTMSNKSIKLAHIQTNLKQVGVYSVREAKHIQTIHYQEGENFYLTNDGTTLLITPVLNDAEPKFPFVMQVWDVPSGKLRGTITEKEWNYRQIDFLPDNRYLSCSLQYSAIKPERKNSILYWDLLTLQEVEGIQKPNFFLTKPARGIFIDSEKMQVREFTDQGYQPPYLTVPLPIEEKKAHFFSLSFLSPYLLYRIRDKNTLIEKLREKTEWEWPARFSTTHKVAVMDSNDGAIVWRKEFPLYAEGDEPEVYLDQSRLVAIYFQSKHRIEFYQLDRILADWQITVIILASMILIFYLTWRWSRASSKRKLG